MRRAATFIALPALVVAGLTDATADNPSTSEPKQEVLFSDSIDHGGFGGPNFGVTRIGKELVPMLGGGGGWLIDHHLLIGGMGWAVGDGDAPAGVDAERMEMALGGLWVEYIVKPDKLVHGTFGAVIGTGGVSFRGADGDELQSETVFFANPHATVEVNMVEFMRLAIQVGYREVWDVDLPRMNPRDLSAFTGSAMLKFGHF